MRLARISALIVGMLSFSGMSLAHQQQQQQCKVALVNMEELITRSDEGRALSAKIVARTAEWTAKMDAIKRVISQGMDQLTVLLQRRRDLALMQSESTKDVNDYREALLASTTKSAFETAKQVAAERGLLTVIDSSSPTTTAPVNGDAPNCDITADVLKRMNAKSSPADPRGTK